MDLRQLNALVAIADHGSFSAAARALFTVQSNVSGHVGRLERELGVTLVDRQRGGLTDEGVAVVERARRILHELDDISADMASRGEEVVGETRLGVIGTTARWVLPQLLAALSSRHPRVHLTITEGNTSALVPRLTAQHLDACILHLPVDEPEFEAEPLFSEDLLLLVHDGHPLAGHPQVSLEELSQHPLMLPPPWASLRRTIDRTAAAAGVVMRTHVEIDGMRLLTSLVLDGFGAAIVPASAVPHWLQVDVQRVAVPELPRRVVGWVQRRRPSPGAPTRALRHVLDDLLQAGDALRPGIQVGRQPGAETPSGTRAV